MHFFSAKRSIVKPIPHPPSRWEGGLNIEKWEAGGNKEGEPGGRMSLLTPTSASRIRWVFEQAALLGQQSRLDPVADLELLQDIRYVVFDRLLRQKQLRSNLPVA